MACIISCTLPQQGDFLPTEGSVYLRVLNQGHRHDALNHPARVQDEGRRARWQAGGMAAGACGVAWLVAYVYGCFMRRRVVQLRLEGEKLRCAALEAQGGLRQRLQGGHASAGGSLAQQQQFMHR